jgi:phosphohistidine phosphatase
MIPESNQALRIALFTSFLTLNFYFYEGSKMKTLFVLRHAKSSWDYPNLSDFDRPLNERGNETAPFMGELMHSKNLVPEVILSSPAKRAQRTAELFKEGAQIDAEILFKEQIYEASPHRLLYLIAEIEDDFQSAMMVGHNPGFEGIVRVISGESHRMPTAALAVVDLDIDSWQEVRPECGTLREIFIPKQELKNFSANN